MRQVLMTGAGAVLVVSIMVIGSIVLWAGTPLAWLWIGAQIQGATQSIGAALAVAFVGVIADPAQRSVPLQPRRPRAWRPRARGARGCARRQRRGLADGIYDLVLPV